METAQKNSKEQGNVPIIAAIFRSACNDIDVVAIIENSVMVVVKVD